MEYIYPLESLRVALTETGSVEAFSGVTLTVAGTAVVFKGGSLQVEQIKGNRHLCTFNVVDKTGAVFAPALGDEVIVLHGATRIFGGIISTIGQSGLVAPKEVGQLWAITASDYGAYCDQRLVTATYPDGSTLKTVFEGLVTSYLTAFGVSSVMVVDGPPIVGEMNWVDRVLTEVLNDLETATGYQWSVNYRKQATMTASGGLPAAAWNITTGDGHASEMSWELTRDNYRNVQYVRIGANAEDLQAVDTVFQGDGTTRHFHLRYPGTGLGLPYSATEHRPPAAPVVSGFDWALPPPNVEPVNYTTAYWVFDPLTEPAGYGLVWQHESLTTLPVGATLTVRQMVTFPVTFHRPDVIPALPWEAIVDLPDIYDRVVADQYADSLLAQYAEAKKVRFRTFHPGLLAGSVITITLANRDLSGTYLITQVTASHVGGTPDTMVYEVECIEGQYQQSLFTDTYRQWAGSSGGSSSSIGGSIILPTTGVLLHVHLGGSRIQGQQTASMIRIENDATFTCPLSGSYVFRTEVKTRNAATTVQTALYDVTVPASPTLMTGSTSAAMDDTDWVEPTAPTLALVAGRKYQARFAGSAATHVVYCGQATLELVP